MFTYKFDLFYIYITNKHCIKEENHQNIITKLLKTLVMGQSVLYQL